MKFRVARIEYAPKQYVYKVVAPWGACIGGTYTDKLKAFEWIRNNVASGAWKVR